MDRWAGKVAIVTDANAEFGVQISKTLAEEGMTVVAVTETKLEEFTVPTKSVKGGHIIPYVADITNNNKIVEIIQLANSLGGVSVLINNAETATKTDVTAGEIDKWRYMFELNVFSAGGLIREALTSMKYHNIDGHIINMSSISAHGVPVAQRGKHVYSSSKHALRLITEETRAKLTKEKSKIKITMISPGCVEPNIFDVRNLNGLIRCDLPKLHPQRLAEACVHVLSTPSDTQVADYIVRPLGDIVNA